MIKERKILDIANIKTGKYDANHAQDDGLYSFFTCGINQLRANTYSFEGELILLPGNGANLGEVFYHKGKAEAYQRTYVLSDIDCEVRYLYYFLKTNWYRYVKRREVGSATNYMKYNDIADLKIPLPPLPIQKKIVQVLDKAQQLIDLREKQILHLDELVQSVFYNMFGDPVTNPKGWEIDSLQKFGAFKNGLNFSKAEKGERIRYLGVRDFKTHSKIDDVKKLALIDLSKMPSDAFFLQNGDMVFVRSNGNKELVGRCIVIYPDKERVTFSGFCIRYRLERNGLTSLYLVHLFRKKSFKKYMLQNGRGANIQNINQQLLNGLDIPIPPISLQNDFAEKVQKIEAQKTLMQESLEEMKNNYSSLMQRAFKGELFKEEVQV